MNLEQIDGRDKRLTSAAREAWEQAASGWEKIGGKKDRLAADSRSLSNAKGGLTKPKQALIGSLWCRLMHAEPMWPSHGRYECRRCGRHFQVCWEQPSAVTPHGMVWPLEAQTHVALAEEG